MSWLRENSPTVTAVDSPRTPAADGESSRQGERNLAAASICRVRFTPDRAGLAGNPAYYEWIETGFELYRACEAAGLKVIECFPTASWTRWAGRRGQARRTEWTSAALQSLQPSEVPARLSQDDRDAIGAALTARAYSRGQTESFGDIVVPAAQNEITFRVAEIARLADLAVREPPRRRPCIHARVLPRARNYVVGERC